ncbi:hypothetical protein C0389_05465 [bacterium]|nr:hypothetical protein [bacterium]
MNGKFRYIIIVLIVAAFSFNSFGFVVYYLMKKESLKEKTFDEISRSKSHERMEVLTFSSSDYEKGKIVQQINIKEIRYEGKMYDIIKTEMHSGKIVFYCVHDEKEDKLEKEFANNVQKNYNTQSLTVAQVKFNSQVDFVELVKKIGVSSPIKKYIYHALTKASQPQKVSEVLTPPPNQALSD